MKLLIAAFFAAASTAAFAQADFDKVYDLYQHGTKPALTEFAQPAAWVGKTVTPEGGIYGGAFFVYPDSDPLGNGAVYGVERVAADANAYIVATDDQIQSVYQQLEFSFPREGYSPLIDTGDPLNPGLAYTSGNGAVDFDVRKASADNGQLVYLIAATCASPSGCREPNNEPVPPGQLLAIVYVWQNRLISPARD